MPARPVKLLAVKIIETETGKKKNPRARVAIVVDVLLFIMYV
jgi:hypothetical protein